MDDRTTDKLHSILIVKSTRRYPTKRKKTLVVFHLRWKRYGDVALERLWPQEPRNLQGTLDDRRSAKTEGLQRQVGDAVGSCAEFFPENKIDHKRIWDGRDLGIMAIGTRRARLRSGKSY